MIDTEKLARMSPSAPHGVPVLILANLALPELVRLEEQLTARPDGHVLLDWRHWSAGRRIGAIESVISVLSGLPSPLTGRWAVVIGPTPVDYGIARMFAARAALHAIRVELLTAVEDALPWLRSEPVAEPAGNAVDSGPSPVLPRSRLA